MLCTVNDSLRKFLEYNWEEEKEHASMLLKWVRRNDETFAREMKTYLLRDGVIPAILLTPYPEAKSRTVSLGPFRRLTSYSTES